jgi:hypothetical protein
MSIAAKIRRAPLRLATGAYTLNSGINKLGADEKTAAGVHGMASNAFPFLKQIPPVAFAKGLAIAEIAVGGALLLPIVPAGVAGLALSGLATGLVTLYIRTPSLHDRYLRPTQAGTGIAKDTWFAAIGYSLVVDAILSESKVTRTEPVS